MPTQINLRTSDAQHRVWTSFAAARNLPLATWIKRVLDTESGYATYALVKPKARKS